jgi:hypothetical protein
MGNALRDTCPSYLQTLDSWIVGVVRDDRVASGTAVRTHDAKAALMSND